MATSSLTNLLYFVESLVGVNLAQQVAHLLGMPVTSKKPLGSAKNIARRNTSKFHASLTYCSLTLARFPEHTWKMMMAAMKDATIRNRGEVATEKPEAGAKKQKAGSHKVCCCCCCCSLLIVSGPLAMVHMPPCLVSTMTSSIKSARKVTTTS